jgi:hypothetical protein
MGHEMMSYPVEIQRARIGEATPSMK